MDLQITLLFGPELISITNKFNFCPDLVLDQNIKTDHDYKLNYAL